MALRAADVAVIAGILIIFGFAADFGTAADIIADDLFFIKVIDVFD